MRPPLVLLQRSSATASGAPAALFLVGGSPREPGPRGDAVGGAIREPECGRTPGASAAAVAARWRVRRRAGQREAEGHKAAASSRGRGRRGRCRRWRWLACGTRSVALRDAVTGRARPVPVLRAEGHTGVQGVVDEDPRWWWNQCGAVLLAQERCRRPAEEPVHRRYVERRLQRSGGRAWWCRWGSLKAMGVHCDGLSTASSAVAAEAVAVEAVAVTTAAVTTAVPDEVAKTIATQSGAVAAGKTAVATATEPSLPPSNKPWAATLALEDTKECREVRYRKRQDQMEFLDCRGCSRPLAPPIFKCSLGHPHFLCSSCCGKLPENKCKTCSGVDFGRCPAMEDAVNSILLPCKYGCGKNITHYAKDEHEKVCTEGPCFCPDPGCGFRGKTTALFDHFTILHKWPADDFTYYDLGEHRLDVPAVPGIRVLRADDGHLFLLKVESVNSGDLKVSLVSVQANTEEPVFRCAFSYEWRSDHSQNVWIDKITNSSLSDGLPEDCSSCLLPSVLGGGNPPLLKGIWIAPTKKVDDEDEMEWEDDDDDSSFDEYEDGESDDHSD